MTKFAEAMIDKAEARLSVLPLEVRAVGSAALNRLRVAAPAMDRLGMNAVRDGLALFGIGETEAAKTEFMLAGLDFERKREVMRQATNAAYQERRQREADADEIMAALRGVGAVAIRAAIPMLLAAI
jgi:hypothetical protein